MVQLGPGLRQGEPPGEAVQPTGVIAACGWMDPKASGPLRTIIDTIPRLRGGLSSNRRRGQLGQVVALTTCYRGETLLASLALRAQQAH
jgi:hypothetical protein